MVSLSARYVPETRDDEASGRLDVAGVGLAALGLGRAGLRADRGPARHWPPALVAALVAGACCWRASCVVEARGRHPMMPLSLFRSRQFTAANVVTLVVYAALSGALFLIPVQLQRVSGFTPVAAGSALLPITAVMLLLSARMGRLAQRIGPRWPMTIGPIVAGAGLALLARVGAHASYLADVLPAVLVFALGLSATVAPLTATALAAAPARQVGVASAVNNDIARAAGLLAVAVLPGLAGITPAAYAHPAQLSDRLPPRRADRRRALRAGRRAVVPARAQPRRDRRADSLERPAARTRAARRALVLRDRRPAGPHLVRRNRRLRRGGTEQLRTVAVGRRRSWCRSACRLGAVIVVSVGSASGGGRS